MNLLRDKETLYKVRSGLSGVVGVVMTMGALHDGHRALIDAARARCDAVLVTIFVNPLQFGPNEDLDRYPRTLDADLALCERAGVDAVFAPSEAEMYPDWPPAVRVDPGPLGRELEGASRPGFFDGVLTVVLKLLHLTAPHAVFFGEKDYQQLALVRRMVRDLDVRTGSAPVRVVGVPTIREPDGLARSSRNTYLSGADRAAALALSAALRAGADAAVNGPAAALAAARAVLDAAPVELDYLTLTDPDLGPAPESGPGRLLVAARAGTTRLIDNLHVDVRRASTSPTGTTEADPRGHKPSAAQE